MKLSEYRNTSSWKSAIELGTKLVSLADDLPASEDNGLAKQLRKIMVELPAAVAVDQTHEGSETRIVPLLKLMAALEIIDKVYPALDTASVRTPAEALAERLMDEDKSEIRGGGPALPAPEPAAPAQPVTTEPAATPVLASEAPAPAPAPVSTSVAVTTEPPTQDNNVHPDNGQQAQ